MPIFSKEINRFNIIPIKSLIKSKISADIDKLGLSYITIQAWFLHLFGKGKGAE